MSDINKELELYGDIIELIRKDPAAIIRERRTHQVAALKLIMPAIILSYKKNKRYHYEKYETAKLEADQRRAEIELAVKDQRDPITTKPIFRNKENREVEINQRLMQDPQFKAADRLRRQMYAQAKSLEDEIVYREQLDQSLIEILALFTAEIEFQTRYNQTPADAASKNRSAVRAKRRSADTAEPDTDVLTVVR